MEHRLKAEWCNENTLRPRSIKKSLDDPNRVFYRFKAFIDTNPDNFEPCN